MFDLRYHVASLAAVFVALTVGIVLGVGISDRGLLRKGERSILERRISDLENEVAAATSREALLTDQDRAADALMQEAYPGLVADRLRGDRVAIVFVGPVDPRIETSVGRALADAGAPQPLRVRALRLPLDVRTMNRALAKQRQLASYAGRDQLEDLGRALGAEVVTGGQTPLWNALSGTLVEERSGNDDRPAGGVVVARTTQPQRGATARFLHGLYAGLAGEGAPAVGVEPLDASISAVKAFTRGGLSSVDWVDSQYGRLALVWLLAGGTPGAYGVKATAKDGVLPPAGSVPEPAAARG